MIVEAILENLKQLIPIAFVKSYQGGIRFRRGVDVAELKPGMHWFAPFFEEIVVVNIQEQGLDLPMQTATTADGIEITFDANVFYQILSVRKVYMGLQDFDHWVSRKAAGHLNRKIRERTYDALKSEQTKLEASLKDTLQTRVRDYGVEIVAVEITSFARTKVYRLLNNVT